MGNRNTKNIKIDVKNANSCGKMCYMCYFAEIHEKSGNKWNMWQSHKTDTPGEQQLYPALYWTAGQWPSAVPAEYEQTICSNSHSWSEYKVNNRCSPSFNFSRNQEPSLQNIFRLSYNNAKITTDLWQTSNLQSILRSYDNLTIKLFKNLRSSTKLS